MPELRGVPLIKNAETYWGRKNDFPMAYVPFLTLPNAGHHLNRENTIEGEAIDMRFSFSRFSHGANCRFCHCGLTTYRPRKRGDKPHRPRASPPRQADFPPQINRLRGLVAIPPQPSSRAIGRMWGTNGREGTNWRDITIGGISTGSLLADAGSAGNACKMRRFANNATFRRPRRRPAHLAGIRTCLLYNLRIVRRGGPHAYSLLL